MFEKFGEMGSWQELNELAKNLWKEGDEESLKTLCKENGIDYQDVKEAAEDGVELYITPTMAAMGRIAVEEKESKIPDGAKGVIYGMAKLIVTDPHTAPKLIVKGKRLDGVWKKLRDEAEKNKKGNVGVACGTDRELKKIILDYYGGAAK
jgi:hypothetical protein